MSSGSIAVMFPGQGSQYIGMAQEFVAADPDAAAILEMAESISGFPLRKLCFEGPMEELTQAACLQPALTAANMICWQAAHKAGLCADFFVGHSLGEYSALQAAGVLTREDAMRLVTARGRIMGEAGEINPGGMAAILGLTLHEVQEIVDGLHCPDKLSVGNHNSGQQIVLSGARAELEKASDIAVARGGKAIPLNVSIANHSPLMQGAVGKFEAELAAVSLAIPSVPVLFNVTAQEEEDQDAIRAIMARQIVSMVRWFDIINALLARDVKTFVEVGPKKVLSGLMKRMLPKGAGHRCLQIDSPETLQKCMAELGAE